MNWREKTEKEKQPEYLFVPSRHIFFDNIREIDKLYIAPLSRGGTDNLKNLQFLCRSCN